MKKKNIKELSFILQFMKKINKIYIAGQLTNASEGQKKIYEKISTVCHELSSNVRIPHLLTDPVKHSEIPPSDIWYIDHREVASADLMIAYVGQPSLGVGSELEIARITVSDIILWWFKGEVVSRMPLGNPAVKYIIEAENEDDLLKQLKNILNEYKK